MTQADVTVRVLPQFPRAIPVISRSLMLPLIQQWRSYKAWPLLRISPLPIPPKAPPGCCCSSPETEPYRRRVLRIPATPVSLCHPRLLCSTLHPSVHPLTRVGARACITGLPRHFSDEPRRSNQLRRAIPAGPRRAATSWSPPLPLLVSANPW